MQKNEDFILENEFFYSFYDLHDKESCVILPKRAVVSFFDLYPGEVYSLYEILWTTKNTIRKFEEIKIEIKEEKNKLLRICMIPVKT